MPEKSNDPLVVWQKLIGEMEKGFNTFANQAMASPEFSKVVNQVGGVTAGAQKQLGDLMEKYFVSMNLPSRAQMASMAERLQSIETQLRDIKSLLQQLQRNSAAPPEAMGPAASAKGVPVAPAAEVPVAPEAIVPVAPKPPRIKRPPGAGGDKK